MKVLFLTRKARDHLALTIWDGLQEVLGEENVVDGVGVPSLHRSNLRPDETSESRRTFNTAFVCQELGGTRQGRMLLPGSVEDGFDLLVLNSCFFEEYSWEEACRFLRLLTEDGRVAYVEGSDNARQIIWPRGAENYLRAVVTAAFRKEIDPASFYPYVPQHLTFAAPSRWFRLLDSDDEEFRTCDVFFAGNPETNGADRWDMMSRVFQTKVKHRVIMASRGLGWQNYFGFLRQSKFALCPATAAGADSLRTYEAVACGAIPVFIDYPSFVRDPWFPQELICQCQTVGELPDLLDSALDGHDLAPMRRALVEYALENHTTRARAMRLLAACGFDPGRDF